MYTGVLDKKTIKNGVCVFTRFIGANTANDKLTLYKTKRSSNHYINTLGDDRSYAAHPAYESSACVDVVVRRCTSLAPSITPQWQRDTRMTGTDRHFSYTRRGRNMRLRSESVSFVSFARKISRKWFTDRTQRNDNIMPV